MHKDKKNVNVFCRRRPPKTAVMIRNALRLRTVYVLKLILFPEPANFLRRMLNENEGSRKDKLLGDPDWLSEIQYNTISPLFADY